MKIVEIMFYVLPAIAFLTITAMWFSVISLWRRAFLSGGKVSIVQIVMTRARQHPSKLIMDAYLSLINSDFDTTYDNVERLYIVHKPKIITSGDLVELVKQAQLKPTT